MDGKLEEAKERDRRFPSWGEGRGREGESRAVRQSRAIPQSGGFEKYLTIHGEGGVHASPNIVATSAANPATPSNPLRVFAFQILAGVTQS